MPSFRRRASVLDADRVEKAQEEPDRAAGVSEALALAEEAEAEAAEAEATAAAARARARAIRLRRQAEAAGAEAETNGGVAADVETETSEVESEASEVEAEAIDVEAAEAADIETDVDSDPTEMVGEDDGDVAVVSPQEKPARSWRGRLPRVSWKPVAAGVAIICTLALLAASGYMVWQHGQTVQEQQRRAEFAAAGRQGVVTLMSLNFNNAQEDVQRIIDNSTGEFRDDFENTAEDFVKVAQESKVITEATVNAAAVESMTEDSAVVLASAISRVTNSAGASQEPRSWRLSVSLQREGGQIKMSKVEFVP